MERPLPKPVTALLRAWSAGDEEARNELLPVIYDELRRRAAGQLRRLVGQKMPWQNRAHFFGMASEMMRRILVDHARGSKRGKRSGGWTRVELDEALAISEQRDVDLVLLDKALRELTEIDPRQGQIVELRFFGGLTLEETAEVVGVSPATVKREWSLARAWLYRRLKNAPH